MEELLKKEQLSAEDLKKLMSLYAKELYIIDVRSNMEYEKYHIKGAVNIHIEEISMNNIKNKLYIKDGEEAIIVTYCNAGGRGGRAFLKLKEENATNSTIMVKNLQHGINSWLSLNYPVEEGKF